jgi:hypothetical protein
MSSLMKVTGGVLYNETHCRTTAGIISVRDGARIKYKLMGFMVYFEPAKNKHLLLYRHNLHMWKRQ